MIQALALLLLSLNLNTCSLVHQDITNEPPVLQVSNADTTRVSRGPKGRVEVEVRASDEDDDPLYYRWRTFRVSAAAAASIGSSTFAGREEIQDLIGQLQNAEEIPDRFDAPANPATIWTAPEVIDGSLENYLLVVAISDRQCELVSALEDRLQCEEEALEQQIVQTFVIEVSQRTPTLATPADTVVLFSAPAVAIEAMGADEDGDDLTYQWEQTGGEPLESLRSMRIDNNRSQLTFIPLYIGDYQFRALVTDGLDTATAELVVHVVGDRDPPEGGMATLTLPGGSTYQIDVYEFPNRKGEIPLLAESWFQAALTCDSLGKRLCTPAEWVHACRGEDGDLFSSPDDPDLFDGRPFGRRFCNTQGSAVAGNNLEDLAASGSFANCFSWAGVYDLCGNAGEWLLSTNDAGESVGRRILSSNIIGATDARCDFLGTPLAPLAVDMDLTSQRQLDSLATLPAYSNYFDDITGFRCCR